MHCELILILAQFRWLRSDLTAAMIDVVLALSMPMCQCWWAGTVGLISIVLSMVETSFEASGVPAFMTFAVCGTFASDMIWIGTNLGFQVLRKRIECWRIATDQKHGRRQENIGHLIKGKLTQVWLDMSIFTAVYFTSNISFRDANLMRSMAGFLLMTCCLDFGLSLWHRILHLPSMYQYHKLHHSVQNTQPWTNEVEHPVEALGNAFVKHGSVVLVSSFFQMSPHVVFAYLMFSTWYGVMVHSGYNLPPFDWIERTNGLRFVITPKRHQDHHMNGSKNLGAITSIWDSLFHIASRRSGHANGTSSRMGKTWKANLKSMGNEQLKDLVEAVRRHGMIVVRNQSWSLEEQEAFTSRLGEITATVVGQAPDYFEVHPRIVRLSNFHADGKWKGSKYQGAEVWHQDGDYMRMSERHILTVLSADKIPKSGGGTGFVDLVAAAEGLPSALRASAEALSCFCSARRNAEYMKRDFTREDAERYPEQRTKVLHRHPRDGREVLLMGSELSIFEDQQQKADVETTKALFQHVLSPQYMYFHEYRPGDVIIWDNLQTLHKAMPFKNDGSECRLLWRAQARVTGAFHW